MTGLSRDDKGKIITKRSLAQDLDLAKQMAAVKREKRPPKQPKGMKELVTLVGELKRDVKLLRDTQSVPGAERWIKSHG
jgi:hypothetical protein